MITEKDTPILPAEDDTALLSDLIEKYRATAADLADRIWDRPELAGHEILSLQAYTDVLTAEGIEVQTGIGEVPTSFAASWGNGKPVIALLAEYDCVSGISQQADVPVPIPVEGEHNGHGCGHNLLGAGCLQTFLALRDYITMTAVQGTVILFGCPAEERGGGKTFMTRAGVFDDVDIALAWHPGDFTGVVNANLQADLWMRYIFTGKSAHAATSPEMGRSALDSVEIMNIGANYLREHVPLDVCFHYAVTDTGGTSPNVVQNHAIVEYLIRAGNLKTANEVRERMDDIARGSALINGTNAEIQFVTGCSQYEGNISAGNQVYAAMRKLGDLPFSEAERHYAEIFAETLDTKGVSNAIRPLMQVFVSQQPEKAYLLTAPLNDSVMPYYPLHMTVSGTSDVGDVSQKCPTVMFLVSCWAQGTAGHSWQSAAQGKSSLAHSGMTYAAKVMALTAAGYFKNPELTEEAWTEFYSTHSDPYACPIPNEIPFGQNQHF